MMTARDRNRRREHHPHGWQKNVETTTNAVRLGRYGQVYMVCPCGWFGWVNEQAAVP